MLIRRVSIARNEGLSVVFRRQTVQVIRYVMRMCTIIDGDKRIYTERTERSIMKNFTLTIKKSKNQKVRVENLKLASYSNFIKFTTFTTII